MPIGLGIGSRLFGALARPLGAGQANWFPVNKPGTEAYRALGYSPDLRQFVCGGAATNIFTSPNGRQWTERALANTRSWRGAAWASELGLWVVCCSDAGVAQAVITSPDGVTWTPRNTPNDAATTNWVDVCYSPEENLFVAVRSAAANQGMTSPDGINWTFRTVGVRTWNKVCYSPALGLFAAIAATGGGGAGQTQRIATSPDGITWTLRNTPMHAAGTLSVNWRGIDWSPELGIFVGVGFPNAAGDATSGQQIMTSPDGINWTTRNPPASHNDASIANVLWVPELQIFIASIGFLAAIAGQFALWSADGITWEAASTPRLTKDINGYLSIAWGPEVGWAIFTTATAGTDAKFARTRTGK